MDKQTIRAIVERASRKYNVPYDKLYARLASGKIRLPAHDIEACLPKGQRNNVSMAMLSMNVDQATNAALWLGLLDAPSDGATNVRTQVGRPMNGQQDETPSRLSAPSVTGTPVGGAPIPTAASIAAKLIRFALPKAA